MNDKTITDEISIFIAPDGAMNILKIVLLFRSF